jgi:integrase
MEIENQVALGGWEDFQIKELPHQRSIPKEKKVCQVASKKVTQIKSLICPLGKVCILPSLYLRELTIGKKKVLETGTAAYALLAYYRHLHDKGLEYDDLTEIPEDGPLFSFRYFLCDNMKSVDSSGNIYGAFGVGTIKSYLTQVALYYEWLVREGYLEVSETRKPLTYTWEVLKQGNDEPLLAHVYKRGEIRFKKRDLTKSLPKEQMLQDYEKVNPLSGEYLEKFREEIKVLPRAIQLIFEMQIQCGLRVSEATTFAEDHIVRPDGRRVYKCRIGKEIDGCHTKNGKVRTIEIPDNLMAQLYEYKLSRAKFGQKDMRQEEENLHPKRRQRLFLSNRRSVYRKNTVITRFCEIREILRKKGLSFNHINHDLRRTFATDWLEKESKEKGQSFYFVASKLMRLLGHESFKTTEKYVIYLSKKYEKREHSKCLNKISEDALY